MSRSNADHLPTPFTAEQIRNGSPEGHTVDIRTDHPDGTVTFERVEFVQCDDEGATLRSGPVDESGQPVGAAREARAAWTDLQAHASFPAAAATRVEDTVSSPLGADMTSLRYDVNAGDRTMTFWFSLAHPGMPVRFTTTLPDGTTEQTTTVIRITDPSA